MDRYGYIWGKAVAAVGVVLGVAVAASMVCERIGIGIECIEHRHRE